MRPRPILLEEPASRPAWLARAASIPIAAVGSVLALLQPVCPANATPPPGSDFVETPIEQREQQAPPSPSPSIGAESAASNGPDFIEQPIEQAPSPAQTSPAPGSGPLGFLNNID